MFETTKVAQHTLLHSVHVSDVHHHMTEKKEAKM
jgi:hypothetical protein